METPTVCLSCHECLYWHGDRAACHDPEYPLMELDLEYRYGKCDKLHGIIGIASRGVVDYIETPATFGCLAAQTAEPELA